MSYQLFSVGDHVAVHAKVRSDRLAAKHRDRRPRVVEVDDRELWLIEVILSPLINAHRSMFAVWQCDCPHSETPRPNSQEAAHKTMVYVPDDQVEVMLIGNARRVFDCRNVA